MVREPKIRLAVALVIITAIVAVIVAGRWKRKPITLQGAVITRNADTHKELPIAGVTVSAYSNAVLLAESTSDPSGYFRLQLPQQIRHGHSITFKLRDATYLPLDVRDFAGDQLYIMRMTPLPRHTEPPPDRPVQTLSDVVVKYSIRETTL